MHRFVIPIIVIALIVGAVAILAVAALSTPIQETQTDTTLADANTQPTQDTQGGETPSWTQEELDELMIVSVKRGFSNVEVLEYHLEENVNKESEAYEGESGDLTSALQR